MENQQNDKNNEGKKCTKKHKMVKQTENNKEEITEYERQQWRTAIWISFIIGILFGMVITMLVWSLI